MKTINDIPELKDKNVLLRVDFDVPVRPDGTIQEPFRIKKQKEMIDWLADRGARVVLVAHSGDFDTFEPVLGQLEVLLDRQLGFLKTTEEIKPYLAAYDKVGFLDNIRNYPGEKDDDDAFARGLSDGFDLYVNNAFAVCHRGHASVSAITKYLPSFAGLLIEQETVRLQEAIDASSSGKIIIMGGAKASTKVPVIKHFMDKADVILVGGVIANDILKARGVDIDGSKADEDVMQLLQGLDLNSPKLVMPTDFNLSEGKILDMGPESIKKFDAVIAEAKYIIWNGPMGLFEDEKFAAGTDAVARAIVRSGALSVIGGGDTIAAVDRLELLSRFHFVSTGGGAMLAFLAGERMPGLESLGYYD